HCVACCVFYQCRLPSFLSRPPLRSTPFPYTTLFRSVAGYLGGHRRAVGKCTGQVRVSGEREEGNGHHGGGLMRQPLAAGGHAQLDRKSTRLNSSHVSISYAVFCLIKKICSAPHHCHI